MRADRRDRTPRGGGQLSHLPYVARCQGDPGRGLGAWGGLGRPGIAFPPPVVFCSHRHTTAGVIDLA